MDIGTKKRSRIRHLVGASCAAALLAGAVGVASAQALPQTTRSATETSRAAPNEDCTSYHNDSNGNPVWEPPGCTPP